MASLDQILADLDKYYAPQVQGVQTAQAALPAYEQAQQAGLDQAKTNAFGDITAGANSRGVLYSGIPIAEQGKYVGSTYLPAVASLKQNIADRNFSLTDSLAKIQQQKYSQGQSIYNEAQQTEAAQAAALAKQQAAQKSSYSGGSSKSSGSSASPDYNSNSVTSWVNYIKSNYGGKNWGQVAKDIEAQAGKIPTGSNLDQALHYVYTGIY